MKKIIFSIVGSMLIGVCSLQAQQTDTDGTASKSKTKQNKNKTEQSSHDKSKSSSTDKSWQQQSDRSQTMGQSPHQNLVVVEVKDVPSSIRQKLQSGNEYAGWEKATVYHNTQTGDYVIVPQPFAFDKQGNEKQMSDINQSLGYDAWQSGTYSSGQNDQQRSQSGDRDSRRSSQQQAQDQMGEIPTSAPEQSDNADQQQDQASQSQSNGNSSSDQQTSGQNTGDQSRSYRTQEQSSTQSDQQTTSDQSSANQYRTEDMVEVQTEQIPASLRRTLRESQYSGWEEKGTLYQDPSTNEYVLVIEKGESASAQSSSQPRAYRFDKNGQLKEEDSSTQSNKQ